MTRLVHLLGVFSLICVAVLYLAGVDIVKTLSPQGCRMSWMSPSYVLQNKFNASWSPLAGRYSLWLYREVGWEGNELHGSPVLFIPGNAGSSHQVRSIASSAARQYYSSPYTLSDEFRTRALKGLDFFAVEFNEDFSAFHGATLDAQTRYTSHAIDYILSLYSTGTPIIIMGHSMGGVVATSLLPHPNISAIITMSTPHTLPPARFDRRVDRIYTANMKLLANDPTPILSMCGGATDLMVPSESCILPQEDNLFDPPYRRNIFTSALEGSWTGVGHREMVWCHQVRWRVARAALELGVARTPSERGVVLDTWLRDGHTLPPRADRADGSFVLQDGEVNVLPTELHLLLKNPTGTRTYVLPFPDTASKRSRFILYVSQGSIGGTSPYHPLPLRASVYICSVQKDCKPLDPSVLKLIPAPVPGRPFPLPEEGSDESEGVVMFEAKINASHGSQIAVRVDDADGRGWVVGGFVSEDSQVDNASAIAPFLGRLVVDVTGDDLHRTIHFPRLLSNSLVVYSLVPIPADHCSMLLTPLLQHNSHPSETHYFPLISSSRILLHTHASAPFIFSQYTHGLNLTIYSSGEGSCTLNKVSITVDWWTTIGRWGTRYAAPTVTWAVGLVSLVLFDAWGSFQDTGTMPTVTASLSTFIRTRLSWMLVGSFGLSFIPFQPVAWLGNSGEPLLSPLAPLILLIAAGLVSVSWWLITLLMWPLKLLHMRLNSPQEIQSASRTNTFISLIMICTLIFLIIPWQVAFLGCWLYHLYNCAVPRITAPPTITAMPLFPRHVDAQRDADEPPSPPPIARVPQDFSQMNEREHLLLLMTWLLPLTAPVLAVWVRTLFTAGLTTPFDGDHNVLNVLPYLVLVDSSWGWSWVWKMDFRRVALKGRWTMLLLAAFAFFLGPRKTYVVYEIATLVLGAGVLSRFVQRYYHVRWVRGHTKSTSSTSI